MDANESKKRLELLKLARKQLNEEYFTRRAQIHQQWQIDSQATWINKGVMLPYPPIESLPEEQDIVARALEIYNQRSQPAAQVKQPSDSATGSSAGVAEQLRAVYESKRPGKSPVIPPDYLSWDYTAPTPTPTPTAPAAKPTVDTAVKTLEPAEEKIIVDELVEEEQPQESVESSNRLAALLNQFVKMAKNLDKSNTKEKE